MKWIVTGVWLGCIDEAVVELFVYVSLDGGNLFLLSGFSGGGPLQVV